MTPDQYCQQKAAQSGSSFYYSFLFLPPERRRAITALFAFCREVDDVVDECTDAGVARVKLAWWRNEVATVYAGAPQHPVAQALVPVVRTFNLPQPRLQEIIDGMEMDLTQRRYADFAALKLYCFRVASVVGLLSAEIFGYSNWTAYAENLGMAFQLTTSATSAKTRAATVYIYRSTSSRATTSRCPTSCLRERATASADLWSFRSNARSATIATHSGYCQPRIASPAPRLDHGRDLSDFARRNPHGWLGALTQRTSLTSLRKLWIAWLTCQKLKAHHSNL
jgi:phytoene synthase